jgi:hypothetical protein
MIVTVEYGLHRQYSQRSPFVGFRFVLNTFHDHYVCFTNFIHFIYLFMYYLFLILFFISYQACDAINDAFNRPEVILRSYGYLSK